VPRAVALVHVWTAPGMHEEKMRILTGGSIAIMCPASAWGFRPPVFLEDNSRVTRPGPPGQGCAQREAKGQSLAAADGDAAAGSCLSSACGLLISGSCIERRPFTGQSRGLQPFRQTFWVVLPRGCLKRRRQGSGVETRLSKESRRHTQTQSYTELSPTPYSGRPSHRSHHYGCQFLVRSALTNSTSCKRFG
jgi:hypothetical protein